MIPDSYANGWRLECALCALAPMVLSLVLLSLPESPLWLSLHARQNGYEHIGGIQSSHPAVNEQTGCGACLLLQGNSKKALHLLVPLLVLYQLSGFGWLMSAGVGHIGVASRRTRMTPTKILRNCTMKRPC